MGEACNQYWNFTSSLLISLIFFSGAFRQNISFILKFSWNYLHFCSLSCIVLFHSFLLHSSHGVVSVLTLLFLACLEEVKTLEAKCIAEHLQLTALYFLHFHSFSSVFRLNSSLLRLCKDLGGFSHYVSMLC